MRDAERERTAADLAADPRRLDRDELISLVERLQTLADRQQATIAEQAAELAGRRPNGAANGPPTPPSRPTAKPVAGFDYTIVFDGGSLGNPGKGYGSFQIVDRSGVVAAEQLDFGNGVTNNQAEFRTLIRALEALGERLGGASASVAVRGDSQLVINTVAGSWKARHPELIPLRDRAVALLREFSRTDVAWQRRSASVRVLGH